MSDNMTREQRSYTMSRIRSSYNESTEGRFVQLLREAGLTGWRRHYRLPGRPDLVFRTERVVVFLDGCFWHGCGRCRLDSKSNVEYWSLKIAGNVARDRRVRSALRRAGWTVVRIWEHELRKRPESTVQRLAKTLQSGA